MRWARLEHEHKGKRGEEIYRLVDSELFAYKHRATENKTECVCDHNALKDIGIKKSMHCYKHA